MDDKPLKADEQDALDNFRASQALDELLRRHAGDPAWDRNPPCPDCGSLAHFECGGHPGLSITRTYWNGERMVSEGISPHDFYLPPPDSTNPLA